LQTCVGWVDKPTARFIKEWWVFYSPYARYDTKLVFLEVGITDEPAYSPLEVLHE